MPCWCRNAERVLGSWVEDRAKDLGLVEDWVGHLPLSRRPRPCLQSQPMTGRRFVGVRPGLRGSTVSTVMASEREQRSEAFLLMLVEGADNGQIELVVSYEPLGNALDVRGGHSIHLLQNLVH